MRRVTLATELINYPSILFCDEPTSGLDSYMAETVVKTLRVLVRSGLHLLSRLIRESRSSARSINHPLRHTHSLIAFPLIDNFTLGYVFS